MSHTIREVPQEADPEVIAEIESLLKQAKRGELIYVAGIRRMQGGHADTFSAGFRDTDDLMHAASMAVVLQTRLINQALQAGSEG